MTVCKHKVGRGYVQFLPSPCARDAASVFSSGKGSCEQRCHVRAWPLVVHSSPHLQERRRVDGGSAQRSSSQTRSALFVAGLFSTQRFCRTYDSNVFSSVSWLSILVYINVFILISIDINYVLEIVLDYCSPEYCIFKFGSDAKRRSFIIAVKLNFKISSGIFASR